MKAIAHTPGAAAGDLHIEDAPMPVPSAGEILIEVVAAGINRPDVFQRKGLYPPPAGASPRLGLEVAGRVAAVGPDVSGWPIGARVMALAPGGGYAEYCVVPSGQALLIPEALSFCKAAALPETWFTVWSNLMMRAHLRTGERLLVHGGASGIGLTAIQLANWLGVEVLVTVGSDEKRRFCEAFGAQQAINYREEDFAVAVRARSQGAGVDVVLDMVGAPYLQRNLDLLRKDGRLVYIAFLQGARGEIDLLPVMSKRLTLTGSTLRPASLSEKTAVRDALAQHLLPEWAAGKLRPHIHARFPLHEVAQAHALMESNRHIGKIVLDVGADS